VADAIAQISLKRLRWPPGDLLRAYEVMIDDTKFGDIRRGETKTFVVPPGRHEIHLEIDWAKSRNLELNLSAGDVASLTCSARPPSAGLPASKNYIRLEIVDGSGVAMDQEALVPEASAASVLAPGAPTDVEMQAAWDAWSQSSEHATQLRGALQIAIKSGNRTDVDRLKREVQAVLADHKGLTAEYQRLKAQRPDWKSPERDPRTG